MRDAVRASQVRGGRVMACLPVVLLAIFASGLTAAPADAARLPFPSSQGWTNPVSDPNYEDWGFAACPGYLDPITHLGADSQGSAPPGSSVVAIAAGKVVNIDDWLPEGRAIGILHQSNSGPFIAVYGHVTAQVLRGAVVTAGERIGSLFDQGSSTHLHLGIRPLATGEGPWSVPIDGQARCPKPNTSGYVNPIPWLESHIPAQSTDAEAQADAQAQTDLSRRALSDGRFLSSIGGSFGKLVDWHPSWELRWMSFGFTGGRIVRIWHATFRYDRSYRYTIYWDPDAGRWTSWERA